MANELALTYSILKGKIISNPKYIDQEIDEYKNNPCIEALPPIFDDKFIVKNLAFYPMQNENEKMQNENIRYHLLKRIKSYYQPLSNHLKIEHTLSCLIRRSYITRNPNSKEYFMRMRLVLEAAEEKNNKLQYSDEVCEKLSSNLNIIPETGRSTAECFSIIGVSGIGKSTAIEKLLLMYPQVIIHHNYKGKPLTRAQIVWIKIDCPFDGSLKTLCKMFFKALDDILLTTNYFQRYGKNSNSTATMMIHMSHLACLHSIGVLVIDEMQHLINPKNKPDEILNFLVTLVNMIGISIIQIGTPSVTNVLKKGLREIRRAEEAGCIFWDRMKEDDEWDFFISNLWEYQWLKNFTPLDEKLKHQMYYRTQGITSIAISLFILIQAQAIFSTNEKITLNLIDSVAKNDLKLTNKVISAIRNNNIDEIANYQDITVEIDSILQCKFDDLEYRKRLKELSQQYKESTNSKNKNLKNQIISEIISMGLFPNIDYTKLEKIIESVVKQELSLDNIPIIKQNVIKAAMIEEERITKEIKIVMKKKEVYEQQDLRYLFNLSTKDKIHIYEILKNNDYIKDPLNEFYT